jgi:very-short-patch-repair endonuclease
MVCQKVRPSLREVLAIAGRQHGLVTRSQLLELGMHRRSIDHRLRTGRLHRIRSRVFAVGSPRIGQLGHWMAAVLACGPDGVLSHGSAGALYEIQGLTRGPVHVSVPAGRKPRQPGVVVHRRARLEPQDVAIYCGIPVTSIVLTFVDLAATCGRAEIETAVNEADKRDLIDPEALRDALSGYDGWPGVAALRRVLDRATFTLTDSQLERLLLPIARRTGLPKPLTGVWVNGYKVDFYWPQLKLIVETDGLRYHRTPTQQTQDRRRDQAHTRAGFTVLRFTHAQAAYEPGSVEQTLRAVARRL